MALSGGAGPTAFRIYINEALSNTHTRTHTHNDGPCRLSTWLFLCFIHGLSPHSAPAAGWLIYLCAGSAPSDTAAPLMSHAIGLHFAGHYVSFVFISCCSDAICLYPAPPLRPGCHSSCRSHSPLFLFLQGVSNRFELFLIVWVAFVAIPLCTRLTLVLLLFLCLSEGGGRGRGPSEEAVSRSLLPRRQVVGPRARQEGQWSKY